MRKLLILFSILLFNTISNAQSADNVVGKWLNKDGDAHIQIYKKGNTYAGKLVWFKTPNDEIGKPKLDKNNPNDKLKNRSVLGLEILTGFVFENGTWNDGKIYDPKSGKVYSCKLSLDGINKLNIRGYVGVSILGRTDVWSRIK
jgi:uncharacterized protein (DUF2147 family)